MLYKYTRFYNISGISALRNALFINIDLKLDEKFLLLLSGSKIKY